MLWRTGRRGGTGDPGHNGQNKHALLGKLLRLDVNGASGYAIPRTIVQRRYQLRAGGLVLRAA